MECNRRAAIALINSEAYRGVRRATKLLSAVPFRDVVSGIGHRGWNLPQVKLFFDSGEPRIHYLFDTPQFFRK